MVALSLSRSRVPLLSSLPVFVSLSLLSLNLCSVCLSHICSGAYLVAHRWHVRSHLFAPAFISLSVSLCLLCLSLFSFFSRSQTCSLSLSSSLSISFFLFSYMVLRVSKSDWLSYACVRSPLQHHGGLWCRLHPRCDRAGRRVGVGQRRVWAAGAECTQEPAAPCVRGRL